jgi:hypothetical protein
MVRKINFELADLLQSLSNSYGDREGRNAIHLDTDEYLNGVKKSIPHIEKALENLKEYLKDK